MLSQLIRVRRHTALVKGTVYDVPEVEDSGWMKCSYSSTILLTWFPCRLFSGRPSAKHNYWDNHLLPERREGTNVEHTRACVTPACLCGLDAVKDERTEKRDWKAMQPN